MALLMVCFYLLKYCQISVLGYFLIISIIGPCLGGAFNTIVGLSTLQLTKDIPPEKQLSSLGMYSAVTMALANFVTALTQMLIGFVAGKGTHSKYHRLTNDFRNFYGLFFDRFCWVPSTNLFLVERETEFQENRMKPSDLPKINDYFHVWDI